MDGERASVAYAPYMRCSRREKRRIALGTYQIFEVDVPVCPNTAKFLVIEVEPDPRSDHGDGAVDLKRTLTVVCDNCAERRMGGMQPYETVFIFDLPESEG